MWFIEDESENVCALDLMLMEQIIEWTYIFLLRCWDFRRRFFTSHSSIVWNSFILEMAIVAIVAGEV